MKHIEVAASVKQAPGACFTKKLSLVLRYSHFFVYLQSKNLITRRFFDPLKMAERITDLRIYGFTEIKPE